MRRLADDPGDRTLVHLVLTDRNERAFRRLYRRHTPYLYQLALRMLRGDETEAEDVVQETWIRAVEGFGGFRWDAAFRSWLVSIMLNVCRGVFRRKDRDWLQVAEEPLAPADGEPEDRVDLERALTRLPDGYRTVLVLHDVEGFTHDEIGRMLGTTAGTSKSQLHHARRTVRALLAPHHAMEAQDHAGP